MNKLHSILVVDDDPDDQMLICDAIKIIEPSINCTTADNGQEAIELIGIAPLYDMVLLDLNMPLMNGFDTLKRIKKIDRYKDIPIVIVSTSDSTYDINKCKSLGATQYIVKPGSYPELVKSLKKILAA